jgi:isocitrate/isopropylmalate dehydrogenase
MEKKIALLPGDGIGQEVAPQAVKVRSRRFCQRR